MKTLILLRHAKAVAKDEVRDFGRVLAKRGRSDMALVARALASEPRPNLALVSPAARTRETWELAGLAAVPVRFEDAIYDAEPETLLGLVRAVPDEARSIVMVGHNPGFEDLARMLTGPGEARLAAGMPTAAFAVLALPGAAWGEVGTGAARLLRFVTPASLGGGPP